MDKSQETYWVNAFEEIGKIKSKLKRFYVEDKDSCNAYFILEDLLDLLQIIYPKELSISANKNSKKL